MEPMPGNPHPSGEIYRPPLLISQSVESLLGASATRHILYLLEGQYLYQTQREDGSLHYKFLSAQSVRLAFSQEPVDSGWLPPHLCRWGYGQRGQWAVLFVPPTIHSLTVLVEPANHNAAALDAQDKASGETSLTVRVPLPGLVFAGVGQEYYLWALKAKEFSPQHTAYHAPLPNIYPDGRICWGTNQVGPVTAQKVAQAWQLFISSPFNSHLASAKSKSCPENVLPRLQKLSQTRRKKYPGGDLLVVRSQWEREGWTISRLVELVISGDRLGW